MYQSNSTIMSLVLPIMQKMTTSTQTSTIITTQIKVLLLQKKQIFYITDGHVIYQTIMSLFRKNATNQDIPKPFNRIRTNYYNFNTKYSNMYLYNQQDEQNNKQQKYLSPYQPRFHFQERMETFNPMKAKYEIINNNQVLILQKWGFKIVNIANTGYYGLVIQVYQYSRNKQKFDISQNIHSVLYQKSLSKILQILRIKDMRQQIGQPNRQNPVSLCYYRKNLKDSFVNKSLLSNFVCADKNCKILKFNSNLPQNYLPLGNITGVMRFIRPMINYSVSKKTAINFNKFREIPRNQNILDHLYNQQKVWTSSSQESQDQQKDLENVEQISDQEQDQENEKQSSFEQQEPLKLIYMKQLEKMNII